MKRGFNIAFAFLILTLSILFFNLVSSAETISPDDIKEAIGVDPDKIPKSRDEIRDRYLVKEWSSIVQNLSIIGPIHNFATANTSLFLILFNKPYSFSLTFLMIFLTWVYIIAISSDLLSLTPILNNKLKTIVSGIIIAVIFAHLGIIENFVVFLLRLIGSSEYAIVRILLWILAIVVLAIIAKEEQIITKTIKLNKKKKKENQIKEKTEEHEEFIKGVKEGQKLKESLTGKRSLKDELTDKYRDRF